MNRLASVAAAALAVAWLAGCPAPDYLDKSARGVSAGLPEQSRLLMCLVASPIQCQGMPGPTDRSVIRSHVRDNATLSCTIATHDSADSAPSTSACKCANTKDDTTFETDCGAWAGVK
jgi:hypothetical protein